MCFPYLALGQQWLDVWPCRALSSVAEQVHDNCALVDGLINLKEIGAGYPSVLYSLFPAWAILSHANDDVQTVVAKIETLAVALRTVADQCKSVVLEEFLQRH